MNKAYALIVMLLLLAGCNKQAEAISAVPIIEGNHSASVSCKAEETPQMYLNKDQNQLYFAHLNFVDEFSLWNEGSALYDASEAQLTIQVVKSIGTVTGAVDGPRLCFVVDLANKKVLEREYEPNPTSSEFRQARPDHNEMQNMTEERLVEIAQLFYDNIFSDTPLLNLEEYED